MRQSSSGDAVRLGLDDDGLGRFFVFELVFDVDVGAELDDELLEERPVPQGHRAVPDSGRVDEPGHLVESDRLGQARRG